MNTKHRAFDLEVKSVQADGTFSGYGSVWGVVDSYRETVAPGAFAESLAALAAKGRRLPVLWQHRTGEPIGQWDVLREDEHGLYGEGTLWTEDAPYARLALRGMRSAAITGLSIGFWTREDSFDELTRIRTLKRVDLVEVSIVTSPANDEARVDTIKAKLAAGELISEREFGKILREKGFSRSDADEIAAVGFKAWSAGAGRASQAAPSSLGDLKRALDGFSLPSL